MAEHQKFYWNELMTDDVPKAKAFYRSVVGWEFEEMAMGDGTKYTVAKTKGGPVGGMMDKAATGGKDAPTAWMAYIHVDDVDGAVGKVAKAGGKVLQPCFDVPGVGRIAMIQDPTGGVVGIMTAKS
jgi:hypothetical protein